MKRIKIMNTFQQDARQQGFSIVEVLIGVTIFAVGMLALASLQGNLARSAADAKQRTVAINLAEQLIERKRGFARMDDPTDTLPSYADISNDETIAPVTIGGTTYSISYAVVDNYYDIATDTFLTTAPTGAVNSDYKRMQVTVTWTSPEFRMIEGNQSTGDQFGTGSITLTETIGSVTTAGSSLVATLDNGNPSPLSIPYTPGERPDVVSLSLGNNRFKESLTPEPIVIRADELVETRFDVITYSQTDDGTNFVRREQFATVSCECTLKAPSGTAETSGRRPSVWAGDEYAEGHWVDKPYGVSASNQQSQLCDTCCRDHHDGGSSTDDHADTAVNQTYPFRPTADYVTSGTFSGNHKHYARDRRGNLSEVTAADQDYVEACRLVRVDGFFQLAQDFRQEDLNIFPADFLDDVDEITTYSNYVTAAADAFEAASYANYEFAPPCIGTSGCAYEKTVGADYPTALEDDELPSWTTLPLGDDSSQQLRSRGIYIDYLSYDLRTVIDCLDNGGSATTCKTGDVKLDINTSTNVKELIPFFDVQLTYLDRWNETPTNVPVDTTNEELQDDNTHSRGVASKTDLGSSSVEAKGSRGNLGFTDTQAIDLRYDSQITMAELHVEALDDEGGGGGGSDPGDPVVSGNLTETIPGNPSISVVGTNGAVCDRTPSGFECSVPADATNPRLEVSGYGGTNDTIYRYACSTGNVLVKNSEVANGANAKAIFELSNELGNPVGSGYNINIQSTTCVTI